MFSPAFRPRSVQYAGVRSQPGVKVSGIGSSRIGSVPLRSAGDPPACRLPASRPFCQRRKDPVRGTRTCRPSCVRIPARVTRRETVSAAAGNRTPAGSRSASASSRERNRTLRTLLFIAYPYPPEKQTATRLGALSGAPRPQMNSPRATPAFPLSWPRRFRPASPSGGICHTRSGYNTPGIPGGTTHAEYTASCPRRRR